MLYTELYDAEACTKDTDNDTSCEILKLQVFARERPSISLTLATDSHLFLSDRCAGDAAFYKLVRDGWIRFPRWPDGKGPFDVMKCQLAGAAPVFSAWPRELYESDALRRETIRCLDSTRGRTGHQIVDKMIEYARALFAAIELGYQYGRCPGNEKDRRPEFAARMVALKAEFAEWSKSTDPADMKHPTRVAKFFMGRDLPDDKVELGSRGRLYVWLNKRFGSGNEHQIAKEIIDAEYNHVLARSFGYSKVHCVFRQETNPSPAIAQTRFDPCAIEYISGRDFTPTEFESITWQDIRDVTQTNALEAQKEIAARYARRKVDSEFWLYYGAAAVSAVLVYGALTNWANEIIARAAAVAAGSAMFVAAGQGIRARREKMAWSTEDRISGYIANL